MAAPGWRRISPVHPEAASLHARPFRLPAALRTVVSRLPQWPPTLALVCALNAALGRLLPRAPLEALSGKVVCVEVLDAGLTLRFSLGARRFHVCGSARAADLTMRASAADFLALALRREDPDTLFFSRRLVFEGDTELGLIVKNTLDAVDLPGIFRR